MTKKNCKKCFDYQENLVTEGGRCNFHGFELPSEEVIDIVYCDEFKSSKESKK